MATNGIAQLMAKMGKKPGESDPAASEPGIFMILKKMGIDPHLMIAEFMGQASPMLEAVLNEIRAFDAKQDARFEALATKLESMDEQIKSLNPDYVPESFRQGLMAIDENLREPEFVTNPDDPDGGAVDMSELDADKLRENGSLGDADVHSLEPDPGPAPVKIKPPARRK